MNKFIVVLIAVLLVGATACETSKRKGPDIDESVCSTNSDCSDGKICLAGKCADDKSMTCASDSECPGTELCMDGSCTVIECARDDECKPGEECKDNTCVENSPDKCEADDDCGEDEICDDDGKCVETGEDTSVTFNSSSSLKDFTCFKDYSSTLKVIGGSGEYIWEVTGLPSGITHDGSSNADLKFSGKITDCIIGATAVSVKVSDKADTTKSVSKTFDLQIKANGITITSSDCNFTVDGGPACELAASGGSDEFTFSAAVETPLPSGVSLGQSATDVKKWEFVAVPPLAVGEVKVNIQACDKNIVNFCSDAKEVKITVSDVLRIVAYSDWEGGAGWKLLKSVTYSGDTATVNDFSFDVNVKNGAALNSFNNIMLWAEGTVSQEDETDNDLDKSKKFEWEVMEGADVFDIHRHEVHSSEAFLYVKETAGEAPIKSIKVKVTSPTGQTAYIVFNTVKVEETDITCNSSPKLMVEEGASNNKTEVSLKDAFKGEYTLGDDDFTGNLKVIGGKGPYEVSVKIKKEDYGELKNDKKQWTVAVGADGIYTLTGAFKYKFDKDFVDKTIKTTTIKSTITLTVKDEGCNNETTEDVVLNVKLPSPNDTEDTGDYGTLFDITAEKALRATWVVDLKDNSSDDKIWIKIWDVDEEELGMTGHEHPSEADFGFCVGSCPAEDVDQAVWSNKEIQNVEDADPWPGDIRDIYYVGYRVADDCDGGYFSFCEGIDFKFHSILLTTEYYYLYVFDNSDPSGEGDETYYCPVGQAMKGDGAHSCNGQKFVWRLRCEAAANDASKTNICGHDFKQAD